MPEVKSVEEVYAVEEAREECIILTKMTEKENTAPDPRQVGPSAVNLAPLSWVCKWLQAKNRDEVAAGEEQR
jgi:hypothetical protein